MKHEQAKAVSGVLKALSHPSRLLAVEALAGGVKRAVDLARLTNVGQSTMSRHLAVLVQVGVVQEHKKGRRVVYRLGQPSILKCLDCARCVLKAYELRIRKALRGVRA